jgi:hypothetical protein
MSDEEKWINYDKPHHLIIREALKIWDLPFEEKKPSLSAKEIPDLVAEPKPAGCFLFDDGTVQNWTLNQLYGWSQNSTTKQWTRTLLKPFTQYLPWNGFILSNHQNLSLSAYVNKILILDQNTEFCDIFFESPDLTTLSPWQNTQGYSIDTHRLFFSHWLMINNYPNKPPFYTAQLQMYVIKKDKKTGKTLIDSSTGKPYFLWAEYDTTQNTFLEHTIDYNKNYHLTFKPSQLTNPPKDQEINIYKARLRCRMPGYLGQGQGEGAGGGHWLIGNICPIT